MAVLIPYLAGLGLVKGIEAEAEQAVAAGPNLYVRGSQFGRAAPLPLSATHELEGIPGVDRVVPRIVGQVVLGKDHIRCVLVGMPVEHFPQWAACIEGRPPGVGGSHQLVMGTLLAQRLGLKVGSRIPPFFRNDRLGERVSEVVGIFQPTAPIWQSYLILTTIESAATIFDQPDLATEILIYCQSRSSTIITRDIIQRLSVPGKDGNILRPEVTSADELQVALPRATRHREGVFHLHFVLAIVVAILVLLVTSGLGLSERRREIGILKATGWQTDEVLLRGLVEGLTLSLVATCVSFLLAWAWLHVFKGYGLTAIFLTGLDAGPGFPLPFKMTPIPLLLGFVFSLVVVLTGSLYSLWRAAVTPPRLAMR
jgi:ABC-type lipoprotein release transport system permease subunit